MDVCTAFLRELQDKLAAAAESYVDLGYFPVPLVLGTKRPLGEYRLKAKPDLTVWQQKICGIGLVTGPQGGGLVAMDLESNADGLAWAVNHPIKTVTTTPRGRHVWYRDQSTPPAPCRQRVLLENMQKPADFRANGGLITAPPTIIGGVQYRFTPGCWPVPINELDTWDNGWLPKPPKPREVDTWDNGRATGAAHNARGEPIKFIDGWIARVHAVSGQGGHNDTLRVATKIVEAGYSIDDARKKLASWNETNANPPWSKPELEHKLEAAWKHVHGGRHG